MRMLVSSASLLAAAALLPCGCATKSGVISEMEKRDGAVCGESRRSVERSRGAWEKSSVEFGERFSDEQQTIEGFRSRVGEMAKGTAALRGKSDRARERFDAEMKQTAEKLLDQSRKADQANNKGTLSAMRGQEKEFLEHRRKCSEVLQRTGVLHEKQKQAIHILSSRSTTNSAALGVVKTESSDPEGLALPPMNRRKITFELPDNVSTWMALALTLIEKGLLLPLPDSVENLVGLDAEALRAREQARESPENVFLIRSMRNYRDGLERLRNDSKDLPAEWKPDWDAEKSLLNYSGDRPAPLRFMQEEGFREGLVNKAYVYDALIRSRGGATDTYDRIEMAYYLGEMIWCAQKLGHPYGDDIQKLVINYTGCLSSRSPMVK